MSFSMNVKEEAMQQVTSRRHCAIAELAAIISMCGVVENGQKQSDTDCLADTEKRLSLKVQTENICVAKKYFTLLKKTFNIYPLVSVRTGKKLKKNRTYTLVIENPIQAKEVLQAVKHPCFLSGKQEEPVDDLVFQKDCCKRAFVRGSFLASGSISDPEKSYHMEIVCPSHEKAMQLRDIINAFWQKEEGMEAKVITRKKSSGKASFVVYLKEGNQISDLLNIMETYRCLMELENIRIKKEIANSVNRKLNCEMANMVKTISAAQDQKNDILYLSETIGLENLPEGLGELAQLRLQYMDLSLKELGQMLTPPVGKSGVNHRLRRIKKIADSLKGKENLHG